ncbi:MAG: hypothetical protein JXA90_14575, partial [Planctomycetes bacterium]|nr:hypothetical protein [Planctomycetota bacterium]
MRPWILPFICLALALASVSCSDSDSSKDTNLWWESSWAEKGEPAPIEMLTPDPQIGHPATAVVRFHADRKAEAVELTLKLLRAEEAQGKVLPAGARKAEEPVEQYVLGEFLLEEVARGLNEYELDMIVPVEGLIARPGEYNIVGCLDPRDLILEGKKAEEDSSSNEEEKDNIFAAEDVRLVFSDEYSYWPNLVVDELTFEP